MKRSLLALPALALAAAACYMPAFDEALSAAYASARKMRHDATIGPYYMSEGDLSRYDEIRFQPKKTANPDGGFMLRLRNGEYRIGYSQWNSGGWSQQENSLAAPYSANAFNAAASVVPNMLAGQGFLATFGLNPAPPQANMLQASSFSIFGAGAPFPLTMDTQIQTNLGLISPPTLIGGGFIPSTVPDSEILQLIAYDATAPGYVEVHFRLSTTPLNSTFELNINMSRFGMSALGLPFPVQPANGYYFYSPATGRSYLSTYESNRWVTYCWYNDGGLRFKQLSQIKSRIAAALSTGELYVENGASGEVYDPDGNQKFVFPIGGMRLAHELYDNGAYRMVFTQRLMLYDNKDGGDQGQWEVYSIPTVELRGLD